ncbi:MAG TPA: hypothetical protein ENK44_03895 [Caldithrix abyssi]|uniref:Glycosyl hydrolase family 13 catalytic domain-containing protein n=1 Tax=Caldithrix abyssi TaxID=187145 RepID=A0A7V4TZH0_CALAY|nr:hypothetical protein [Caldithrix abyssi]
MIKYGLPFIFLLILACQPQGGQKQSDIIAFLHLEAGKTDSVAVDEIFFARRYMPYFEADSALNIRYLRQSNTLLIQPDSDFEGLTFIRFRNGRQSGVIPVKVNKKSAVIFRYKPGYKAQNIFVMGNFNNWNRHGIPMHDRDGDGVFEATVHLDDGIYEYQFVTDRGEIYDPENPEKVDNGFGYFNSLLRVSSPHRKLAPNLYFIPAPQSDTLILALESAAPADSVHLFLLWDNRLLPGNLAVKENGQIKINRRDLPDADRLHRLRLVAAYKNLPGNTLSVWFWNGKLLPYDRPELWQDAVIYSLMIDRFYDGNPQNNRPVKHAQLARQANFNGGDLAGIIQKIEEGYFDSLGVNTLWISPVNKTTDMAYREWPPPHRWFSGYHGYWPVRSREVEPRFGSLQDFKQLVQTAHKHGLRVLLDFISNHTHIEHPYFKHHRDWYGQVDLPNGEKNIRRWDEYRLTTWFDTFLPSFDYLGSQAALDTMTDNAVWWLRETGIDGFRHDATKHVPYKFWKTLTRKIKTQVTPSRSLPVYQIGETFGGHQLIKSYVNNGMLNAQFSFNQFFVARRVFAEQNGNLKDLAAAVEKALRVYGYSHVMGNIMDSHDQVRMMALLDGDLTLSDDAVERAWQKPVIQVDNLLTYQKERVFMTYLLTVPGVPIIYYGDEFGMTGAGDPDNRRMMRFAEALNATEKEQLRQITRLIRLRKNHPALRRGDYKTLLAEDDLYIFTRGDMYERLLVAINKSNTLKTIRLTLPQWIKTEAARSLLHSRRFRVVNNEIIFPLEPWQAEVWLLE